MSVSLSPILNGYQSFLTTGLPNNGGFIYTYLAGTTTPATTYTTNSGSTPNANPIPLSADGRPPQEIWITDGTAYKLVVTDSTTAPIPNATYDNITGVGSASLPSSLAGSGGSAIVGFIQAGAGAVSRTAQSKMRESFSVKDFGAVGDGATDDTVAITAAVASLAAGGRLYFPSGTYLISTAAALNFSNPNVTVYGDGSSSILKAKSGANLVSLLTAAASGICIRDFVLDGNRGGGGINPANYGLYVGASNFKAINIELRFTPSYGTFLGSGTVSPTNISFDNCWVHDNGGVTNSSGFGVGIYGAGAFPANDIRIENCRIENNYNTVTLPGTSNGINILAKNVQVINCFFQNNYNVSGGQLDLVSDASSGSTDGIFVVTGNIINQTSTFGGDSTSGIEIDGRKVVVTGNIIYNASSDGIRVESSAGDNVVSNNVVTCTSAGINMISSGGSGIYRSRISDNQIFSGATGISLAPGGGVGYVIVENNFIDPSIAAPIAGSQNMALIRGNFGYNPAASVGAQPGASPYTWPKLNYDATYILTTANGITGNGLNGFNVSISVGVPIFVKANQTFSTNWTTTAPIFTIAPQE